MEHRAQLGGIDMAPLPREGLGLAVDRHRVAGLGDHDLRVEPGPVQPALPNLLGRRRRDDAGAAGTDQLLPHPADAHDAGRDVLDLLADLPFAQAAQVCAPAGAADARFVGDQECLLYQGELGTSVTALRPGLLPRFLPLFWAALRCCAAPRLPFGVWNLLRAPTVEGSEQLLNARVLAGQLLLQTLDQQLEHLHDGGNDGAHRRVEFGEYALDVGRVGHPTMKNGLCPRVDPPQGRGPRL